MSVKHIGLVLDNFEAPAALKLVAIILADHADADGLCWPSYRRIAQRANMTERSVARHVVKLRELGIITKVRSGTVVKREGRNVRLTNMYRMNEHTLANLKPHFIVDKSVDNLVDNLDQEDTPVHLEVDTAVMGRTTPVSTKPSMNHQLNRQRKKPGDKLPRNMKSIDTVMDELFGART